MTETTSLVKAPSRVGAEEDMGLFAAHPGQGGTMSWREFREWAGKTNNRAACLRLISAATGFNPLPHQLRAFMSTARNKLLLGGVGSGKTKFAVVELAILAMMNPGCNFAMFSPTYDGVIHVLRPEFEFIMEGLARIGCPLELRYHKSMARADLVGGGSIFWRSANRVDSARGFTLAGAVIDEVEAMQDPVYVFNTISGRLRAINANVHELVCSTTPRGFRGIPRMFHERRIDATTQKDWWAARAPTQSNIYLPEGFLEALQAGHSKRSYAQEVEGKVLSPQNLVFNSDEFNEENNVRPWIYDPTLPYHLACDWGYAHPYFAWIQEHPDGSYTVFKEFFQNEVPIGKQKDFIVATCKALGKDPETATGDRAIKDMMQWLIHTFPRTHIHRMKSREEQSVLNGIEIMRTLMDPISGQPKFFISKKLSMNAKMPRSIMHAMLNYRWKVDKEGLLTDQPYKSGVEDHAMDAIRMCMVAISDKRAPFMLGSRHEPDIFRSNNRSRRRRLGRLN